MRSTAVPNTSIAAMSIYAPAGSSFRLVEVSVSNTTTTAFPVALARFTTATNVGAAQTEGEYDEDGPPPLATIFAAHTGAGGVGGNLRYYSIGAAVGAGVIWTFGNGGIVVPSGTGNGIGVICPTGAGQICDIDFTWDE
jgi:hypothetical protein